MHLIKCSCPIPTAADDDHLAARTDTSNAQHLDGRRLRDAIERDDRLICHMWFAIHVRTARRA